MNVFDRASAALERLKALDRPAATVQEIAGKVISGGPAKDVLSGTWLGHPVHPMLVALPIGAFVGGSVLDVWSGASDPSADRMLALGLVASVPTAAAGVSDWSDTGGPERRLGFVHALGNVGALALYGLSLAARAQGRRGVGAGLAAGGAGMLMVGGYLGGHLAYALGVGVDTTVFQAGETDWTPVLDESDLPDGSSRTVAVDHTAVMVTRRQGQIFAVANRCTHRGGALADGEDDGLCVTCPWHGSTFRVDSGDVVRGPAVRPQPTYQVRLRDGRVELARSEVPSLRSSPT